MSQSSTNGSDRRRVLMFAVAAAAVPPFSEIAFAYDRHNANPTDSRSRALTSGRSQKVAQTGAALRDLWVDHIFWVRSVSVATIDNNELAAKVSEQKAVSNAKAIASSIEPFYGAAAKDRFFELLANHYGAVKAYLVATIASDASAQATAAQSVRSNAEEIAVFLNKANPYLPKEAVQGLLLAHGGHHIQQIQQLKNRKYEAEAETWEGMKQHVYQIADATTDALVKQFTKKFT